MSCLFLLAARKWSRRQQPAIGCLPNSKENPAKQLRIMVVGRALTATLLVWASRIASVTSADRACAIMQVFHMRRYHSMSLI